MKSNRAAITEFSKKFAGVVIVRVSNKIAVVIALAVTIASTPVLAHEMFVRANEYVVAANTDQIVRLINGTFEQSENSISRDRMADVSILANGVMTHPSPADWTDDENSSYLKYRAGEAGTYVIGVSTKPNIISMTPEEFVAYLQHDNVLDTLATFEKENQLTQVRERYSKHVRTIVQVGDTKTSDYAGELGYPVEILLDQSPSELRFGDDVSFRVLFKGEPVSDQRVRASYEGFHDHDAEGNHLNSYDLVTDSEGRATFLLSNKALWYITLIHMQKIDGPEADYESNWATITFKVK
ncbi:MAG: putative GH25 family protein [Rhodothermales bacterium]